ncbi:diacylglycerol/lipid kinase family protein [Parablautia muri]|uniref:Diacylglycerol kinase family lipid kinase n=1 Tax=Parablautia muri TaxID=2320879 RepID=A0A9X5BDN0_9FIRM|nr:diacylglycerol kinase family protein [Parablautia muri]NBJ91866.1 diacylglycerol kinase family lipid kinase [Parablautia muri]
MEKKKMLFIYNPRAGKAKIRSNLLDIIDIFTKAGFEVVAYPTQSKGDGIKAVKERKLGYYDIIACSGGDGTLDEVVTGMMQCERRIPIGYVPAGSTNDFAKSLHIPKNMIDAAHAIVDGESFGCDIGSFNNDIFVYIAAFGIFTDVSYETRQDMKNILGHMAYILEGMRRLSAVKFYEMKIEGDEFSVEGEFLFGMVTNSISVGGFKNITGENVKLDDGEFEVTLIKKPSNAMELNLIMAALVNRNINTDCMYCFKAKTLKVYSQEEVAWTLDGEFGGKHKEVKIQNQKQALRIRIPMCEK